MGTECPFVGIWIWCFNMTPSIVLHADPLVITHTQKKPPTETLTLMQFYICIMILCVCMCARRHVSLPTLWVCVSRPSSVCLLQGPCLSLTKRGSLCPLLPAEETDTSHHTPPPLHFTAPLHAFSLCFSFVDSVDFTNSLHFPSSGLNHRLALQPHRQITSNSL